MLLRNKQTGVVEDIPEASARKFLSEGEWEVSDGSRSVVESGPQTVSVPTDALRGVFQNQPTEGELGAAGREQQQFEEDQYGGFAGGAEALGIGAARGLTLGLSDAALKALGVAPEELAALRRVQHGASVVGEVGGAVAPVLLGGGAAELGTLGRLMARTPAGLVARAGGEIAGLAEGGGLAARALATGAAGAVEGGAQGGGQALSDAIIEDKPLTAEAFLASVGSGALYGAAFGAGGELAVGAAKAAARGGARLLERAVEPAEKAVATAGERSAKVTEQILTPGPRQASADELSALQRVGGSALEEGYKVAMSPGTPIGHRAILSQKLDDLEAAGKALAGGEVGDQVEAVTTYHGAVKSLAEDLDRWQIRKLEVPPNPVARAQTDAGTVASVGELVPDASQAQRAGLRNEVKGAVTSLDQAATPILEEARQLVSAQAPIEQIAGLPLSEILGKAEGQAGLAQLVTRAEKAQDELRRTFGLGRDEAQLELLPGPGTDEIIEKLMASPPAEFTDSMRKLGSYDDAMKKLAVEVDRVAPPAVGPGRAAQLEQVRIPRHAGATPPMQAGWDAGDILALADLAGLHIEDVPIIGKLPGIGAILKARLAYRRLRGAAQKVRMIGSAGKVGSIAARARAVRDGVGAAVERFVTSTKPVGHLIAPPAVQTLHAISYGPGKVPEKETKQEAFSRVAEELAAAHDGSLKESLRKQLSLDVPDLVDPILEAAHRKIQYLYGALPKDPREPSLIREPWQPDALELDEFAERVWAAEFPLRVLHQVGSGQLTPPAAETFREVYPALFSDLQRQMVERLSEGKDSLSLDRQAQLSILLDMPVSSVEDPSFVAAMQEGYANKQPGPQPGQNPRMAGLDQMTTQPTPAEAIGAL